MPRKYPVFLTVLNIFFFINGTQKEQIHATQAVMRVLQGVKEQVEQIEIVVGQNDAGQSK